MPLTAAKPDCPPATRLLTRREVLIWLRISKSQFDRYVAHHALPVIQLPCIAPDGTDHARRRRVLVDQRALEQWLDQFRNYRATQPQVDAFPLVAPDGGVDMPIGQIPEGHGSGN